MKTPKSGLYAEFCYTPSIPILTQNSHSLHVIGKSHLPSQTPTHGVRSTEVENGSSPALRHTFSSASDFT
jgi:hypothetical protein